MSKIRVYELAKELHKSSRDIMVALKKNGTSVESHMSLIPDEAVEKVRDYFKDNDGQGKTAAKARSKKTAEKTSAQQSAADTKTSSAKASSAGSRTPASKHRVMSHGTIDSRGNFVMSSDNIQIQPENVKAEKHVRADEPEKPVQQPVRKKQPEKQSAPVKSQEETAGASVQKKADTEKKHESDQEETVRTVTARAETAGTETEKTEAARTETVKTETAKTETVKAAGAEPERERRSSSQDRRDRQQRSQSSSERRSQDRGQDRSSGSQNRDGRGSYSKGSDGRNSFHKNNRTNAAGSRTFGGNRDRNSGAPGQNRQGQKRFNLGSAINKEVVPSKDSQREGRRGHKDNRDNRRNDRDYDEMREHSSRNSKNNNRSNTSHYKNNHKKTAPQKPAAVQEKITSIEIPETITIKELADKMKIPAAQIIKKQFLAGNVYTINSTISFEEAENIAIDYDILCEHEKVVDIIEEMLKDEEDSEENMVTRPPVVCVMGHVDHGKTSILDAIRKTNVTGGEAGGITQHIGAYVVDVKGQKITFLDTPGHEAFTAMRMRGAQSTDIAILVVAADDGVMPQTIEAINHAKAAGIDIIVAINKIDKPGANVDRVKQELMEYDLVAEDWGGKTIMVPVSAHTGEGLEDLLDMILLDAEVLDLKANPRRKGRGIILEAQLDKGRGAVATVLVQKGTLHIGDNVTCGTAYGKIRAMIDDKGKRVKSAGPSMPVEVLGLNSVPESGEVFLATDSEKEARSMAETFIATNREKMLQETRQRLSLDSLFEQIKEGQIKELNIVVKADVQGSVEAVKQSLTKLSNDEVAVKIIHGGVGAINESDVILASASNAIVIGFNVRPDNQAKAVAEQEHVDIRLYRVIYNAIEDIEAAMKGMLEPEYQEKIIGHAEVRQTYKVSGVGTIIGGYVQDGQITRSCKARLIRDNIVMYDGELGSLKRFKDDVKEVNAGFEFGMSFDKYNDIKVGDQVEAYVMEEVPR